MGYTTILYWWEPHPIWLYCRGKTHQGGIFGYLVSDEVCPPVTGHPVTSQPGTIQSASPVNQALVNQAPVTSQSVTGQLVTGQLGTIQPVSSQ